MTEVDDRQPAFLAQNLGGDVRDVSESQSGEFTGASPVSLDSLSCRDRFKRRFCPRVRRVDGGVSCYCKASYPKTVARQRRGIAGRHRRQPCWCDVHRGLNLTVQSLCGEIAENFPTANDLRHRVPLLACPAVRASTCVPGHAKSNLTRHWRTSRRWHPKLERLTQRGNAVVSIASVVRIRFTVAYSLSIDRVKANIRPRFFPGADLPFQMLETGRLTPRLGYPSPQFCRGKTRN